MHDSITVTCIDVITLFACSQVQIMVYKLQTVLVDIEVLSVADILGRCMLAGSWIWMAEAAHRRAGAAHTGTRPDSGPAAQILESLHFPSSLCF